MKPLCSHKLAIHFFGKTTRILAFGIFLAFFCSVSHGQGTKVLTGIINNYAKVIEYHPCTKSVDVVGIFGFSPNQKVLMIQFQGASIDTSNTPAFGTVLNYNNAGNCEVLEIDSIKGSTIIFKHAPMRLYDPENAPVQLVTIPVYDSAEVNIFQPPLTCEPWNGSTGGVLAFEVRLAFDLAGMIDISGKGYYGGLQRVGSGASKIKDYRLDELTGDAGEKGRGIALLSKSYLLGRGAPANGGGGGNAHNSGGGGGGNGGRGGIGSKDWPDTLDHIGGIGGNTLPYQQFINDSMPRLFMGGGGGAGHDNNNASLPGGAGGGLAFIRANNVIIRDFAVIKTNGNDVGGPRVPASNDGYGGGGAGGTIYFDVNRFNFFDTLTIETKGGKGGSTAAGMHGPGGGGGGGVVLFKMNTPNSIIIDNSGGMPGLNTAMGKTLGAEQGSKGIVISGIRFKESTLGVMTLSASKDTTICEKTFATLSVRPIGGNGPYTYRWEGMNITDPNAQTTTARPTKDEMYRVLVTDSNGCVNYALVSVKVLPAPSLNLPVNVMKACKGDTIVLRANSAQELTWYATKGLLENKGTAVRCIVDSTRTYTVYAETLSGCSAIDTIRVEVEEAPTISGIEHRIEICPEEDSIKLPRSFIFGGVPPYTFAWYTQNDTIEIGTIFKQITVKPTQTTVYYVAITSPAGCIFKDSISVIVNPSPLLTTVKDTVLCKGSSVMLDVFGADTYEWTPNIDLSDATSAKPIASPKSTTTYVVKGTSSKGCSSYDTVTITIVDPPIKPIITRRNDTLFVSGNAQQYEWLLNGNKITKGIDSILVIDTSGYYSVTAFSQYCTTLSDSIFVSIGNATIILDSIIVNNNENGSLNITATDTSGITGAGISALIMTLSWNPTVAEITHPDFGPITGDTIVSTTITVPIDKAPILATLKVRGLLGNAPSTSVKIDTIKPIGGILRYKSRNGNVLIGDICYEGGVRLWHPDKSFAKASISVNPHPVDKDAQVILRIPEQGAFTLRAVSINGNEYAIAKGFTLPGIITATLSHREFSPGMYVLMLDTKTEHCSLPIIISN